MKRRIEGSRHREVHPDVGTVRDEDGPPRHVRWEPMLVNALEAGHYWAAKLGWDRWLAAGYQAHRGRILGHFWRHGSFAEAVQEFEEDPELAAGAAVAEEEQRQDFEHLYGHLRAEHP